MTLVRDATKLTRRLMSIPRLNKLSVASRVHILEPQWNPYVEDQAIGRVFRMGQSKNVCAVRYVMETSVEEVGITIPSSLLLIVFNLTASPSDH